MIDIVTVSNAFNVLTQKHSFFNHYHFGYQDEINHNHKNNFDPHQDKGNQYPVVMFDPPSGNLNLQGRNGAIDVVLYFYDLQDYENNSEARTDTLLEQWRNLQQAAIKFLQGTKQFKTHMFVDPNTPIQWDLDSHVRYDKLIFVQARFRLIVNQWDCSNDAELVELQTDWDTEIAAKSPDDIERLDAV